MGKDSSNLVLSMDEYERVTDEFRGAKVWWVASKVVSPTRSTSYYPEQEKMYYRLTFHKRYREMITGAYMGHVVKEGKEIRVRNRQRKLYTNSPGYKWPSYKQTVFEHPATFETMALEPDRKEMLKILPPGTGKSTMIAAMANLLNYDVYDLELTSVKNNTELRKLLIETTCKSIIVIEDIDCSLDLTGQRKKRAEKPLDDEKEKTDKERKEPKAEGSSKATLSGLLNSKDGLWSACGGESFEGFKVLAKNYLNLDSHPMFDTVHGLMKETNITPADVAENLMPKSPLDNAEKCLSSLIQALEEAKEEAAKRNAEKEADRKIAEQGETTSKQIEDPVPAKEDAAQSQENSVTEKPL
ncbi:hypothetical protein CRYUN_Cryun12cG0143700 [Craigia yunnanensis]